jgi:IS1 family transposase
MHRRPWSETNDASRGSTKRNKIRNVKASRIQCDEIWSFCCAKDKNVATAKAAPAEAGDVWTWTAIDADTKLIMSYFVGDRSAESACALMDDLASRTTARAQVTTDGYSLYINAVEQAFGSDIDHAQLVKLFGSDSAGSGTGKYSPPECAGVIKKLRQGSPDPAHISTSYVERMNLSIRMQNRRFTRLTNAFSKKLDNHIHMLALYSAFYNFTRSHKCVRMSPAMASGITDRLRSLEDIVAQIEADAPAPSRRGPYKKREKSA